MYIRLDSENNISSDMGINILIQYIKDFEKLHRNTQNNVIPHIDIQDCIKSQKRRIQQWFNALTPVQQSEVIEYFKNCYQLENR